MSSALAVGEQRKNHSLRLALLAAPLCAALTALPAAGAGDFPGLKSLMTVEEFERSGLNQLTPEQLDSLDSWFGEYSAEQVEEVSASASTEPEPEEADELVSRITGDFSGWDGKTVFRLENGQIWQQRLDGEYRYTGPPNPQVRISRNWLGWYMLKLFDGGRAVGVKRLR